LRHNKGENPAEDFYERKHLNSDLICCNFTELSDEDYYECLRWANKTLMKNYYDKQRESTLDQIDYLYDEKDTSFRGFRHRVGGTQLGNKFIKKSKVVPINGNDLDEKSHFEQKINHIQGNEIMDGLVNWENSSSDGERFSQEANGTKRNKAVKSFDVYLKRKEIRATAKKTAKQKVSSLNKKKSEKELLTT
jgi:hypothetical protein